MAEADLRLTRLLPANSDGTRNFGRSVAFTFHGACRAIPDKPDTEPQSGSLALADIAIDRQAILPYSDLNCDRPCQLLSSEELRGAGAESRLGMAMARVLAHERYRVLLQTREHGTGGITQAAHTPSALLAESLRFDQDEIGRFHAPFRKPPAAAQNMSFRPN